MVQVSKKTMNGNTGTSSYGSVTTNGQNSSNNGTTSKTASTDNNDWSTSGTGMLPGRELIGPILLMIITPLFVIIYFHVVSQMNGNFINFYNVCIEQGFISTVYEIWPTPYDIVTWKMIVSFLLYELLLMKIVPGKMFVATITNTGHRPIYKANGTACYIITLVTSIIIHVTGVFNLSIVYDKFGTIISSLNVFAWIFCLLLLVKGYTIPSSTDYGTNGSIIMDFYWGMELFPRVFGWDIKQFTNCRAGLMFWAVSLLCFCCKNYEIQIQNGHGAYVQYGLIVSVLLQLIYLTKFYHWEMGYMCSMDIQVDRAGYYICWGCLVWVPAIYTSSAFYLTTNAPNLSLSTSLLILFLGTVCIYINYDSDRQRYEFRQSNGQCTIWGNNKPAHIVAKYTTTTSSSSSSGDDTITKTSLLLTDGYWKLSRHFHYVPEIAASFFWSVSALDSAFIAPYFYVIYLTILLIDRAYRDDAKCSKKYGIYWDEYCTIVPYKIIPGIL